MMKKFAELLNHVKAENAKTIAWVKEDPKNRWAGMSSVLHCFQGRTKQVKRMKNTNK